ncbi:prolyl endopeptidase [Trichonephila clavipes]|nr:prolyl endopeptidase [Trichonephila clavipes]
MFFKYPEVKREETAIDEYHGVKVPDPYQWLEDPDSEETKKFVSLENDLSIPYLASCESLGSNPSEDMDGCKCTVPSQQGYTLNSLRATSPLVRLVAGDERWEDPDPSPGCSPSKLGGELNRSVTCMVLKATANDRRTSSPLL